MKFTSYLNNFIKKWGFFLLFLVFGLFVFTYPMLFSKFDLMPGDGYDVKSFALILEHSYKWLLREPTHLNLFCIPFYYPIKNTLFLSDALIGLMPFYWVIRVFSDNAFSAVQAFIFVLCILNYSSFYYLLKNQLKFEALFSSIGAYLFAFSVLRYYRLCHLNYFSQFILVIALIFLLKINKNNSSLKNHFCFLGFVFFLVLQFYTCFSYGFYFCFLSIFGLIFSLFIKNTREKLLSFLKCFWEKIILYGALFFALVLPLALFYLSFGLVRDISEVYFYLQPISAWIRNLSILDCFIFGRFLEYKDVYQVNELSASTGVFASIFGLVGIFRIKNYKSVFYFILVLIFLCSVEINGFVFWKIFYEHFFGAQGIRAIVRISLMSLLILPLGVAFYLKFLKNQNTKISKILLYFSIFLIMIEQIPYKYDINSPWKTYSWSKSKFIKQINKYAKLFSKDSKVIYIGFATKNEQYLSPEVAQMKIGLANVSSNALSCWVAMKLNKFTVSGYSGFNRRLDEIDFENVETQYATYDIKEMKILEDK